MSAVRVVLVGHRSSIINRKVLIYYDCKSGTDLGNCDPNTIEYVNLFMIC